MMDPEWRFVLSFFGLVAGAGWYFYTRHWTDWESREIAKDDRLEDLDEKKLEKHQDDKHRSKRG